MAAKTPRTYLSPNEDAATLLSSKMHYDKANRHVKRVWGQGPPLIFVHSWGDCAAQWALLAMQISKLGFRSVALDFTWHGYSPKWRTG